MQLPQKMLFSQMPTNTARPSRCQRWRCHCPVGKQSSLRQYIARGCKPIDEGDGNTLRFYLSERGVVYYRRNREKARNILSVLRNFGTTEQMRSELERMDVPFQYPKPK